MAEITYTWNDLYDLALDKGFGDPELKAKDEARHQIRCLAMDLGYNDLDDAECPEDMVEDYCEQFEAKFDWQGNLIEYHNIINTVRQIVLEQAEIGKYNYGKFDGTEFISFGISEIKFSYDSKTDMELTPDFDFVIAIVPKRWLYDLIKKTNLLPEASDEEAKDFLENICTYDDCEFWWDEAVKDKQIVAVHFS